MAKLSEHFQQTVASYGFTEKEIKRYNLEIVPRIIDRLEGLQGECQDCADLLQKVPELIALLPDLRTDKSNRKQFRRLHNKMEQHLAGKHKIVRKGHHTGTYMFLGMMFGIIFADKGAGLAIGLAVGLAIGVSLDKKAEKEGRVL